MKKLLYLFLFIPLALNAQQDNDINGDYSGYIDLKTIQLKVIVHLQEDDRRLSGSIDIPEQNAKGLKLENVKLSNGELSFALPDVPGNARFTGTWKPAADSISGTFMQNGMSFKMLTKKMAVVKEKPQLSQFAKMARIEAYIDSIMRKGNMAGCAVGIIQDGEVLMNRGFGYRDNEKKIKCDANTLFAIGSCTKAFTAALLASLKDEGLFDWEKPVKQYVPYFGMKDRFADAEINGIDICTHRSGLPRHDLVWYGSALTRKELVERIRFMEPNKPFRTTWQYNNFMFATAGVIAEEITHDTWENLIQKRIFVPLGMKTSKVHFSDFTATENKSLGYKEKGRTLEKVEYRNIDAMGPAGSVFSTSTDMIEWMRFLLNKGKVNGKQVISSEQVNFLLEPKMLMGHENPEFKQPAYAMGWIVSLYKDKTFVEHGGNIDGFTSDVVLIPEKNIGIVVLSNKDGTGIAPLTSIYIADRLLDHEEYDWFEEKIGKNRRMQDALEKQKTETAKKTPKEKTKDKKPAVKKGPQHALKDYAGEYYDPAYGTLKINYADNQLTATYNSLILKMEHDAYETFAGKFEEEKIKMAFFTNTAGKVEWVQIQLEPLVSPVIFKRKTPDYLHDKNYMDRISGDYVLEDGIVITLAVKEGKFMMNLSDGQEHEMEPSAEDMFKIKGIEGYNMEMLFDEKGNAEKLVLHQPNGEYHAVRKK